MALVAGSGTPQTLEDALTGSASTQTAALQNQYTQARKRLIAQQAAQGRLSSGVADYPLGELDTEEGNAEAGVQTGLESALGQIPAEDYLNQREFARKQQLAHLIGSLNSPSTLEEALGGLKAAGSLASTMAAFA